MKPDPDFCGTRFSASVIAVAYYVGGVPQLHDGLVVIHLTKEQFALLERARARQRTWRETPRTASVRPAPRPSNFGTRKAEPLVVDPWCPVHQPVDPADAERFVWSSDQVTVIPEGR
jgi:hypothetical protein